MTRALGSPHLVGDLSAERDNFANTFPRVPHGQRAPAASCAGTAHDTVRRRSASSQPPAPSFFVPAPRALDGHSVGQRPCRNFPRARGWEVWEGSLGRKYRCNRSGLARYSQTSHVPRARDYACERSRAHTCISLFLLGRMGSFSYVVDPPRLIPSNPTFPRLTPLGRLGSFGAAPDGSNKIGGGYAASLAQGADQGLDRGEAGENFRLGGGAQLIEVGGDRPDLTGSAWSGGNGGFPPFPGAPIGRVGMAASEWRAKGEADQRVAPSSHKLCRLARGGAAEGDRSIAQAEGGTPPIRADVSPRSLSQPFFWVSGLPPLDDGEIDLRTGAKFEELSWGPGRGFRATWLAGEGEARRRSGAMVQGSGHGRLRSRQIGAERGKLWAGGSDVNA